VTSNAIGQSVPGTVWLEDEVTPPTLPKPGMIKNARKNESSDNGSSSLFHGSG
jgi:hypothetical protein